MKPPKWYTYITKSQTDISIRPYAKSNPIWIAVLNMESINIKILLEEIKGEYIYDCR